MFNGLITVRANSTRLPKKCLLNFGKFSFFFFLTHPKVGQAEGSGSAIGGPCFPRHPPPWISEGPPAFNAGGLVPYSISKFWEKGGDFFLKPKIEKYKVLPNGVFIPHF